MTQYYILEFQQDSMYVHTLDPISSPHRLPHPTFYVPDPKQALVFTQDEVEKLQKLNPWVARNLVPVSASHLL